MNSNITGIFGRTISLICRVKNLGNRTVSWVRHRDTHLLTVGRYTYTSDQRFEAVHIPHTEDWTLRIKYPQKKDTGIYECQISTTPPMGHFVLLTIVEPTAEIIGHQEVHIDAGSTINLTCAVLHATETRRDVWWSRDGRPIDAGSPRGGVSVVTEKGAKTTSRLLIRRAGLADSGMYKCEQPEARVAARVVVHVLEGEYPAAMYHGNGSLARKSLMILLPSLVFLLIHQSAT